MKFNIFLLFLAVFAITLAHSHPDKRDVDQCRSGPYYVYLTPRTDNVHGRYVGVFANGNTVVKWYNAVEKLNMSIEKVSPGWYTLETVDDVNRVVYESDIPQFKSKSFWLLLGDTNGSAGRNMPIIPAQVDCL